MTRAGGTEATPATTPNDANIGAFAFASYFNGDSEYKIAGQLLFRTVGATTTNGVAGRLDLSLQNSSGSSNTPLRVEYNEVSFLSTNVNLPRSNSSTSTTTSEEVIIGITDTSAARTVTLQTADVVGGRVYIIKDESGAAGTNNITVDTQGAETIDGQASIDITANYGCLRVYSNGTNWFTF
jgi:hypothetical protein